MTRLWNYLENCEATDVDVNREWTDLFFLFVLLMPFVCIIVHKINMKEVNAQVTEKQKYNWK